MRDKTSIGQFELTTPKLLVTDPCYSIGTWCTHLITDAVPGTWNASIVKEDCGEWGNRVAEIRIWNEAEVFVEPNEQVEADIGVDSGQCGFFDYTKYPQYEDSDFDYDDKDSFYGKVCRETHDEKNPRKRAGVVDEMGAVSSSGYGDGSYDLWVGRNDAGNVVSAKVVFLPDEEASGLWGEDYDDGQPDEAQEWYDYDPDC